MGWSRTERGDREAGFATAAATMISLALAVVATAVTAAAIKDLDVARADFVHDTLVYDLASLHERAAFRMLQAGLYNRLRWTQNTPGGNADVLAEAENPKLSLAAAAAMEASALDKLGVKDAEALRDRLKAMKPADAVGSGLEAADTAPLWRACARSLISAYGDAKVVPTLKASPPVNETNAWHVGDVWRVRVTRDGWMDDRMIRFSGDSLHPEVIIDRRLYRAPRSVDECDALFTG